MIRDVRRSLVFSAAAHAGLFLALLSTADFKGIGNHFTVELVAGPPKEALSPASIPSPPALRSPRRIFSSPPRTDEPTALPTRPEPPTESVPVFPAVTGGGPEAGKPPEAPPTDDEGIRAGSPKAPPAGDPPSGGIVISNPRPRYPEAARLEGREGTALLKVKVLPEGRVGAAVIERSSGYGDLDRSAVEAVMRWTFLPSGEGEKPASASVRIQVVFKLNDP